MNRRAAMALTAVGLVGVVLLAGRIALPGALERALERKLRDDEDWTGRIGRIELDLLRAEAVVHGFHVDALSGRKVLKSVDIPVARVSWRWDRLWSGVFDAEVVAERPTVVIGTKTGPKEPDLDGDPLPDPGWFRFTIDAVPIDGTFVHRDLETDPHAEIVLTPVTGRIEDLGTVPGPATFDLVARAPNGGTVRFDALMDFWNAHLDAFDMRFLVDDLDATGLPSAARAYLGTELDQGVLDATFGLTLDKGRRELPPDTPMFGGPTDDLARGSVRLELVARDVVPASPPIEHLAADRIALVAEGAPVGDAPFVVVGDIDGLDARVTRAWIERLSEGAPAGGASQLPPIEVKALDVDGQITFVDRSVPRPIELTARDLALRIREADGRSALELSASVRGATLEASGTAEDLGRWPTDLDLRGALRGLHARAVERELRAYLGVHVERGTLDALGEVHVRDGVLGRDLTLYVRDARFRESDWTIASDRAVLHWFEGEGVAKGVSIDPSEGGALQHITAERAQVTWSPERLRQGVVVATVTAHRPVVVVLERPVGREEDDAPDGGKVPWSLDVVATEGTVVWRDPVPDPDVEIAIEAVDGTIRRLGTLHPTSLWDLEGELPGGGEVHMLAEMDPVGRDREQPWRLDVAIDDASLPALQEAVAGYLGRPLFAAGMADAELSIVWMPGPLGVPQATGRLVLDGRELAVADPPVDTASVRELSMDVRWDPSTDEPYRVLGEARGLFVEASRAGLDLGRDGGGTTLETFLRELPPFRVERFTVDEGRVRYTDDGDLPLDLVARDVELTVYGLQNLDDRAAVVRARADLGGGELNGTISLVPLSTPLDFDASADLRGVPAVRLNEALEAWAGLDVDEGVVDLVGEVAARDGELTGALRTILYSVDFLQLDDLEDPLEFLKSVAAGVLVDLVDREDVAAVTIPVDGTVAEPRLEVIPGLLRALRRSIGVGVAADADAIALDEEAR